MPPLWTEIYDYPTGKREKNVRSWVKGEPRDELMYEGLVWVAYRVDKESHQKFYKLDFKRS